VRDALIARGIDGAKLTTRAAGRTEPVADNATGDGRAMNRRAELKIPPK
jgi:OmpA-OmpF porin, OOP family